MHSHQRILRALGVVLAAFVFLFLAGGRRGTGPVRPVWTRGVSTSAPVAAAGEAGVVLGRAVRTAARPEAGMEAAKAGVETGVSRAVAGPSGTVFEMFRAWAEGVAVGVVPDALGLDRAVALAKERRVAMETLIRTDPRRALEMALPWRLRQRLPGAVVVELEEPVSARGRLEVLCAWQGPGAVIGAGGAARVATASPGDPWIRTFTVGEREFRAYVYGRRLGQQTAEAVVLQGIAIAEAMAVSEEPARLLEPEEVRARRAAGVLPGELRCVLTGVSADGARGGGGPVVLDYGGELMPVAGAERAAELQSRLASVEPGFRSPIAPPTYGQWSHGVKRLLFMRVRFPDDLREPVSEAEAAEVMRLANEYFVSASFNTLDVITTVGPLVTLPQPKLYYAVKGTAALLKDAREATRVAGVESSVFDLDMVRFVNVPGFTWAGLASVGGRGVWLQSSALGVICHELGHNLGLSHANFWNTVRAEPPPNPQNLPFDAGSLVGIDSAIGPGDDIEYGDPFDVMGSGGSGSAHYTALHKYLLGWVPEAGVRTVTNSGVYRVHAHDLGVLASGESHSLRVRKDAERFYWISVRGAVRNNPWLAEGVELHWNGWHQAIASSELIDTTPGSAPGKLDAALTVGRTFVDEAAQVFVTPLRRVMVPVQGVPVPALDVAVNLGPFPDNRRPELELSVSADQALPGEPVILQASATDPDGDPVAYAWDLGDGVPAPNAAAITNVWAQPGDYVVRCEITDLRGGVASKHRVVRVGNVGTLRIAGTVLDQSGEPLAGVRVHNGRYGTNSPYAPEFRSTLTDSEGRYTLVGLTAGEYEVGGFRAGYTARPLNFTRPLILNEFTGVDVDLIATALPRVAVRVLSDGDDGAGRPVVYEVSRRGPTNELLRVYFRVSGTAVPDEDYVPWKGIEAQTNIIPTALQPVNQVLPFGFAEIPPGARFTNLSFAVTKDTQAEGDETLTVTLQYPVTRTTMTETETNTVDIPGWEVTADNGRDTWFQTRVKYELGAQAEAVGVVRDGSPLGETTISIVALERGTSENPGDSASFLISRVGRVPGGVLRIPLRVAGTATAGDDYEPLGGFVTLPVGVDAVRLVVMALDDRFVEGNETVVVRLEEGDGYRVGAREAVVVIVDNDLPLVSVSSTEPVVQEAGAGGRVTFQRTGDLDRPLEVDYLAGGTAVPGVDYATLPGRVVIPAGLSTATVEVVPVNDGLFEGDETVVITIGDSPVYNPVSPSRAVVIIRDDEFPTVTVEATDDEAMEGGDDPGLFTLRRTGPVDQPLVVRYRFGGSAVHQADFVASGDRVTIPAGQVQANLVVTPIDDSLREDAETIAIELEPDPAYIVGVPSGAAVALADNGDSDLAVGFGLLTSRFPESRQDPEISVRISGNPEDGPENAVTVAWEVLGGTATGGEDYVLTNGTLSFAYADPGSATPLSNRVAFIPLKVIDDLLPERDETVVVRLRIAPTVIPAEDPEQPPQLYTNGVLDVYAVHTLTLVDDDRSDVRVRTVAGTTREGAGTPGRFVIERVGQTNVPQPVLFHLGGLASAGADYLAVSNRVVLQPNQTSVEVEIVPIDDPEMEYRENVVLTLVDAPGSRVSSMAQAELFIEDNDGTLQFGSARFTAVEADPVARVVVRREGDLSLGATAQFEAVAGSAQEAFLTNGGWAGDFFPVRTEVSFAPGESLKEVEVSLLDDQETDGPKTVRLGLSRGSSLFPLGGQNTALLTIRDDDSLISTGTNTVAGIETEGWVEVVLVRSGPVDQRLEVAYETADFTAAADEDYVTVSGLVVFGADQREARVWVPLLNDFVIEGEESLLLRISTPLGAPLGEVSVVVVDDDCALQFSVASVEVDEDGAMVELQVDRVGSPLKPVKVDYATVSGTATEGDDYEPVLGTLAFLGNRFESLTNGSGEVVFRLGETNRTFRIRIVNDSEGERDEAFSAVLVHPRSGDPGFTIPFVIAGAITNLTVSIRDNEAPGRVDDSFQPGLGADAPVRALAVQQDGKILVGGDFSTFDGLVLPRLARLHADGFVDRSFNPGRGLDGSVWAVAEVADGRVMAGGSFTNVDDVELPFLARLEPDGTRATDFAVRPDAAVRVFAMAAGSTGEVYVGGDFTTINGAPCPAVARLSRSGVWDATFRASGGEARSVRALAVTGGGVLVGGVFDNWDGSGAKNLVRLGSEGAVDRGFPVGLAPNGPVHTLVLAPDGSVYLGGEFSAIGGFTRAGVARLLEGGLAVDSAFDPGSGANGTVLGAGLTGGDRVMVGGRFEQFGETPVGRFARLLGDGRVDEAFFRGTGANEAVRALVIQPDGAIVLGGDFTEVNGRPRSRVARIHADEKFAEGFVEFSASVFGVGEAVGEAVVEVRRTGSAKLPARVGYLALPDSAEAGLDFERTSGELEFAAGEVSRTFRIPVLDDKLAEGSETVRLVLTNAIGSLVGRRGTAALSILDDEVAVAFELPWVEVDEKAGSLSLEVRRSGSVEGPARVAYRTESGTATAGQDFVEATGVFEFAAGAATGVIRVMVRDDAVIEGDEQFRVVLSEAGTGLPVGSQSSVRITVVDDDRLPTHHTLVVESGPGGLAVPTGGRFPTNSVQTLRAFPDRGFEFARWEGTVTSADNPLLLRMDRDHVLRARFRPRDYLETFETGGFGELPWITEASSGWGVTNETASSGRYSARSGRVGDSTASVLALERVTESGGASFDFRTASEAGWDFLEFQLNGELVGRWSGVNGWQTFQFNVPAGINRLVWTFRRDRTFGGIADAVWIDNLDLPEPPGATPSAPRLAWVPTDDGPRWRIEGVDGWRYALEVSEDLRRWSVGGTGLRSGEWLPVPGVAVPGSGGLGVGARARFQRLRVEGRVE